MYKRQALTQKLADRGYRVLGVDDSAEMVAEARALHPGLPFQKGDAVTFQLEEKADVIFSNAVLHWIDGSRQQALARNVAAQLKPGGHYVIVIGNSTIRGVTVAVSYTHLFGVI